METPQSQLDHRDNAEQYWHCLEQKDVNIVARRLSGKNSPSESTIQEICPEINSLKRKPVIACRKCDICQQNKFPERNQSMHGVQVFPARALQRKYSSTEGSSENCSISIRFKSQQKYLRRFIRTSQQQCTSNFQIFCCLETVSENGNEISGFPFNYGAAIHARGKQKKKL